MMMTPAIAILLRRKSMECNSAAGGDSPTGKRRSRPEGRPRVVVSAPGVLPRPPGQTVTGVASSVPARTLSKQELQYTGRSLRGANGTTACPPQAPQTAAWNSRGPPAVRARLATALHDGHRCGSFTRPLLAKKVCSPAEKMNSSEQSRQVIARSWYTLRVLLGRTQRRPGSGQRSGPERGRVANTVGRSAFGSIGFV